MSNIRYTHTRFLRAVAQFEGFRSSPYQDSAGNWTIGFGHTHGVTKDSPPITYDDALILLAHDLESIRSKLLSEPYALNSVQWDAIVDFCFNLGLTAYKNSTLRRYIIKYSNYLDSSNFDEANKLLPLIKYQFERWKYITLPDGSKQVLRGLQKRREQESFLFLHETYE